MQYYNTIPNTDTTFGEAMNLVNDNFSLTRVAIGSIEHSTSKNKGLFPTDGALENAVPDPTEGDWALVGESFPAAIYVCNTSGAWVDTGETYDGDSVDLSGYVKSDDFISFKEKTETAISDLKSSVLTGVVHQTKTSVAIFPNRLNVWGAVSMLAVEFFAGEGKRNDEYMMEFTVGSDDFDLSLPASVRWSEEPEWKNGSTYQVSVVNDLAVYAEWEAAGS